MPGVNGDCAELYRVEKSREISAHNSNVGGSALCMDRLGADDIRNLTRILLEEGLAGHSVGKPLEDQRPVRHYRKHIRRNCRVIAKQVALGELPCGKENLAEVGYVDADPARNFELSAAAVVLDFVEVLDDGVHMKRLHSALRLLCGRAGITFQRALCVDTTSSLRLGRLRG